MSFLREIWQKYQNGNTLTRLLFINVAMFLFIIAVKTIAILLLIRHADITEQLFQFHWDIGQTLRRPWTLFTAMFTSHGIWHLLFNMVMLYWFGTILLQYFNNSTLRGIYVIGAISSMVFYSLPFYLTHSLDEIENPCFPAASGAILSIATLLAFKAPNHTETFPVIGPVHIKILTLVLLMVDIALFPQGNPATDCAHLGAFLSGLLFYRMYLKGIDMAKPVTQVYIFLQGLIQKIIVEIKKRIP